MSAIMTSTSDEVGHTATPWEFKRHGEIFGTDGRSICSIAFWAGRYEQGHANAAFIVRAVNSHDSLVKALELVRSVRMLDNLTAEQVAFIDAALSQAKGGK